MISINRMSDLLHRINFLKRQRTALNYSYKYVITDGDVLKAKRRAGRADDED